jgi:hypothetical protein
MDSFNLTILVLIITIFLFSDKVFFDMIYNSKSGRFVIVVLLIATSVVSIWLSFIFLMAIMYFSQFNKTPTPESFDKMDRVNVSDVLNNNFLYKNHKLDNVYKKSKKSGLNVVRESEKIRPKSSKFIPPFSARESKSVTPYSKNIYYTF